MFPGARRFTVQGLEGRIRGLYDDSLSDPSDSSRPEIPDDLFSVYRNMTKEVVYICDMESSDRPCMFLGLGSVWSK